MLYRCPSLLLFISPPCNHHHHQIAASRFLKDVPGTLENMAADVSPAAKINSDADAMDAFKAMDTYKEAATVCDHI